MAKKIFIYYLILMGNTLFSQKDSMFKGNINFHYGTIIAYNTISVGYETPDLIKRSSKHCIRPLIRLGFWNSNLVHFNSGAQGAIGISYLLGNKKHHLEHSSEFVMHFDKGLKGQKIVYIGGLYRPFIGYRYEADGSDVILRAGIGWKELLQLGIGYKL